jgi:hypothetical protein
VGPDVTKPGCVVTKEGCACPVNLVQIRFCVSVTDLYCPLQLCNLIFII